MANIKYLLLINIKIGYYRYDDNRRSGKYINSEFP